jgi:hypothetical protein
MGVAIWWAADGPCASFEAPYRLGGLSCFQAVLCFKASGFSGGGQIVWATLSTDWRSGPRRRDGSEPGARICRVFSCAFCVCLSLSRARDKGGTGWLAVWMDGWMDGCLCSRPIFGLPLTLPPLHLVPLSSQRMRIRCRQSSSRHGQS